MSEQRKEYQVPERQLSYGELLNGFYQTYHHKQRVKEQAKTIRVTKQRSPKKPAQVFRHEYSYGEVMQRLKDTIRDEL